MAETKPSADRPKPASGGLPTAGRIVHVIGGEEAGSVDTAVPAIVVRAYEVGENDARGYAQGEHRADIVVFNAHGPAATPYTDVLVLGNGDDAQAKLDDANEPRRRADADVSPAYRGVLAFWPSR